MTDTIPENVKTVNTKDLKDDEKQALEGKPIDERVDQHVTFLTKDKKLIYPELKISQIIASIGKQKSSGGKPSKKVFSDTDLQTWYYDKVCSMFFPTAFVHILRLILGWLYLQQADQYFGIDNYTWGKRSDDMVSK